MTGSIRIVAGTLALSAALALQGCDREGGPGAPTATDDIVEVTAAGAASIPVLDNDSDAEGDTMSVSIDDQPTVGSAAVNSDNTVRLDLPSDFRGVTRFRYKVSDPDKHFDRGMAVVFVDAPAYRLLFSAGTSTESPELYVGNLAANTKISNAVSGSRRLESFTTSETGGLVVYTRSDPANRADTTQKFQVHTTPVDTPVEISAPGGRRYSVGFPGFVSPDDKYVALVTESSTSSGLARNLYLADASSSSAPVHVGNSESFEPALTFFAGDTPALYFVAPVSSSGTTFAVFRADLASPDPATRVSPIYGSGDTIDAIQVSPDQTKIVIRGQRSGQSGLFLVDPAAQDEQRLSTDLGSQDKVERFLVNEDTFDTAVYLARMSNGQGRLDSVSLTDGTDPQLLQQSAIDTLDDFRLDGAAVLVTRASTDSNVGSNVVEIALDTSVNDVTVATAASRGAYDNTGNFAYVLRKDNQPAAIARSDFGRAATPLLNSTLSSSAFVLPVLTGRSAYILGDSSTGLSVVNLSAPGKVLQVNTQSSLQLDVDSLRMPLDIAGP